MAGLVPATVRAAIKSTLDAASISRALAIYAYRPFWTADQFTQYPCLIIGYDTDTEYMGTFGPHGLAELHLRLELRTESSDCISAEMAMDAFLAAGTGADSSVFDALLADPTFGGVVGSSIARTATPPRPLEESGVRYWSSFIPLTVYASRS